MTSNYLAKFMFFDIEPHLAAQIEDAYKHCELY